MSTVTGRRGVDSLRENDPEASVPTPLALRKAGGVGGWFDDRTGVAKPVRYVLKKVFPDHWSFMLGEIAMYSLVVLLLTGTFLTFWYVPSASEAVYNGSYIPLKGITMSEAYKSTLDISFDIRGGLIIRQIHHWAALLFVVSIMVHMFRVFFTGAFRKPREINWVIGTVLSMLAIIEGFAGYSLPDDLLSGTGLRAAEGFMQSAPVVGSYLAYFVFDGAFPGSAIIPRLFTVHVLLIPALIVGLFTAHILLVFVHKHTQFPGPGRTNDNVVGYPLMPVYIAKAGGFFFIVFGAIAIISALFTINPIWMYGPYDPSPVTAGSQPDWYMGFADGALRLMPGWTEIHALGYTLSLNVAVPALGLIPLFYGLAGAYPFLEQWVTGDKREHHLLDRPRNAPVRTGIGVMALVSYGIFMFASANDIMAIKLGLSINDMTQMFRVLLFVAPPLAFWVTKRVCMSLQRRDRDLVLHGRETGRLVRTAEGKFFEVHEPVSDFERYALVQHEPMAALTVGVGTDDNGVRRGGALATKVRARVSQFYFADTIDPVTPGELAAAHHDGQQHEAIEGHDEIAGEILGGDEPSASAGARAVDESQPRPDVTPASR